MRNPTRAYADDVLRGTPPMSRPRRRRVRLAVVVGTLLALVLLAVWRLRPPARTPLAVPLPQGLLYRRIVTDEPVGVVHVIEIPAAGGRRWFVTPPTGTGPRPFAAATVEDTARRHGLLAAVNADYFAPQHDRHPFDSYPHAGDPVATLGPSASDGAVHRPAKPGYFARHGATVCIDAGGAFRLGEPDADTVAATSGGPVLLQDGRMPADLPRPDANRRPQSAVGYRAGDDTAFLVVVDGRRRWYSEGMTSRELSDFARDRLHATLLLGLDGGGSSALAARVGGAVRLLSHPVHHGLPGTQRPVATCLGIRP